MVNPEILGHNSGFNFQVPFDKIST